MGFTCSILGILILVSGLMVRVMDLECKLALMLVLTLVTSNMVLNMALVVTILGQFLVLMVCFGLDMFACY